MKTVLLVLALTMGLTTASLAQTDKNIVWKKEEPRNAFFSKKYHLFVGEKSRDCFVNVRADGRGLTVLARTKEADGGFVLQRIDIEMTADGAPKVTDRRYSSIPDAPGYLSPYHEDPTAGDVFSKTYLEAAKLLPQEVRSLFFGRYLQ